VGVAEGSKSDPISPASTPPPESTRIDWITGPGGGTREPLA